MGAKAPKVDCRICGACCTMDVWLEDDEVAAFLLQKHLRRLLTWRPVAKDKHQVCYMRKRRVSPRSCVAFRGEIGEKCACAIYEDRPRGCRRFHPGNMACREVRREFGLGKETWLRRPRSDHYPGA